MYSTSGKNNVFLNGLICYVIFTNACRMMCNSRFMKRYKEHLVKAKLERIITRYQRWWSLRYHTITLMPLYITVMIDRIIFVLAKFEKCTYLVSELKKCVNKLITFLTRKNFSITIKTKNKFGYYKCIEFNLGRN